MIVRKIVLLCFSIQKQIFEFHNVVVESGEHVHRIFVFFFQTVWKGERTYKVINKEMRILGFTVVWSSKGSVLPGCR